MAKTLKYQVVIAKNNKAIGHFEKFGEAADFIEQVETDEKEEGDFESQRYAIVNTKTRKKVISL